MAVLTKKRNQSSLSSRPVDLSHMTRPTLDPLVQQTLESVGMRARKAFSDGTYHRQSSNPVAQRGMKLAIASAAEVKKPLPFYEIKSAKDPWASFRAAGQDKLKIGTNDARIAKRGRDETDDLPDANVDFVAPTSALQAAYSITDDPNDLEFTNPPWLASQESLQSDDEMQD